MLTLPAPRGATSRALLGALVEPPHELEAIPVPQPADALSDDDLHLSLYLLYELHYRGLPGVADRWEWHPGLLAVRARLEELFEAALVGAVWGDGEGCAPEEMDLALRAIADADDSPSLSQHLAREGTLEEFREFVVHRSAYQLKEADPHSFALARIWGRPKAAMVEIQADEYGGGRFERMHAQLFADTMEALGLDARYGAYVDQLPGCTLATVNLMSLLALHRRRRGAIVGHLALFEMTSSIPNRRYADGLRRLGVEDPKALEFYVEHVEADAVHENLAAVDLAGGLARQDPALAAQVLFGARCLVLLEGIWAREVLSAWTAGRSSLRGGGALDLLGAEAVAA